MNEKTKSQKLLDKVYAHLNSIDVTKLSMDELKDFLEVVQKGQFLESYGKIPSYGFGYGLNCAPVNPCNTCGNESDDSKNSNVVE